ncbi:MAG: ATP-binding cassette domain-containing protein [Vampirovibrionales bacterium]|nr:ATP-binding cassette domain-containing protein [Vampirovibrionales bacterium]
MTTDTQQQPWASDATGVGPLIQANHLVKAFGNKTILDDVSLTVAEGEIMAIIGVSGCGKSTLLRVISGLETADSGEIMLGDPNVSFVFQYSALFDSLTVFENVAFSLLEPTDSGTLPEVLSKPELHALVADKLKLVGLEGTEDKYPSQLSGGMKKRVSFARAIMGNPKIIFYDEPTAGLDPVASTQVENCMLTLRDTLGAASIVVTHQNSTIHRTADRVSLLHAGKIQWEGTPAQLLTDNDPYAVQFSHAALEGPLSV